MRFFGSMLAAVAAIALLSTSCAPREGYGPQAVRPVPTTTVLSTQPGPGQRVEGWQLRAVRGATLEVEMSADNGCRAFHHFGITESPTAVYVVAIMDEHEGMACTAIYLPVYRTIELSAPLGDRQVESGALHEPGSIVVD